jgi:TRAP-type C4-dicarboxylate transport system permease large subunit
MEKWLNAFFRFLIFVPLTLFLILPMMFVLALLSYVSLIFFILPHEYGAEMFIGSALMYSFFIALAFASSFSLHVVVNGKTQKNSWKKLVLFGLVSFVLQLASWIVLLFFFYEGIKGGTESTPFPYILLPFLIAIIHLIFNFSNFSKALKKSIKKKR